MIAGKQNESMMTSNSTIRAMLRKNTSGEARTDGELVFRQRNRVRSFRISRCGRTGQ